MVRRDLGRAAPVRKRPAAAWALRVMTRPDPANQAIRFVMILGPAFSNLSCVENSKDQWSQAFVFLLRAAAQEFVDVLGKLSNHVLNALHASLKGTVYLHPQRRSSVKLTQRNPGSPLRTHPAA